MSFFSALCFRVALSLRRLSVQNLHLGTTNSCEWVTQTYKIADTAEVQKVGSIFDDMKKKERDKETFLRAINIFSMRQKDKYALRGQTEFVLAALKRLSEYGVQKDKDVYRALVEVFPKKKMVARSLWQQEFLHYPKQQFCVLELFSVMECNGVTPDDRMGDAIVERFGPKTHVMQKFQRMMYWMPKFHHTNPYPVPFHLPSDPLLRAVIALKRMNPDPSAHLFFMHRQKMDSSDNFIACVQSPEQVEILKSFPEERPLIVEGLHTCWLRDQQVSYFVLKADPYEGCNTHGTLLYDKSEEITDYSGLLDYIHGRKKNLTREPSLHEQREGTIFAMAVTAEGTLDSARRWISHLSSKIEGLHSRTFLFRMISSNDLGYLEEGTTQMSVVNEESV